MKVTTYYLQMTDPAQLKPSRHDGRGVEIRQAKFPSPELARFFYTAVGGAWYWIDRLAWTYAQWNEWLKNVETWVAYIEGTPAAYFQLEKQPEGNVEIAYFGLLPQFIGRGLGGYLLSATVRRAWEMGAQRVWVHTCTLDHPRALAGYQDRGFRLFKQEDSDKELPHQPPGPWPGA
jgi:GNAT superfamily N-acetyltransferase